MGNHPQKVELHWNMLLYMHSQGGSTQHDAEQWVAGRKAHGGRIAEVWAALDEDLRRREVAQWREREDGYPYLDDNGLL